MTAPKEMFLPSNRNEWTSLVRPPDDYRLDCAIGTSYGLNFTALTALLLAMLDQPADEAACENHARRLQAITTLDERVRVLVNRGEIHADIRESNRVFALLDRIVDDIHIKNAAFHPKVWVLKYLPRKAVDIKASAKRKSQNSEGNAIYRVLCTSRNLTLNSNWEAVARLDGHIDGASKNNALPMGREIAAFFARATKQAGSLTPPLHALLLELPRVAFSTEGSKAVQKCEFLWQWPGDKPLIESVESDGQTALVVSPFVRKGALEKLAARFKRLVVVSRQEELDNFWDESIEKLIPRKDVWVVKPDAADEDTTEREDIAKSLDLHAKLLFCEYAPRGRPRYTVAWLGSANASPRGWGFAGRTKPMNCEAMVRFTPGIRPEEFLEQFAYRRDGSDSGKNDRVMNGWIEPYIQRPVDRESEAERVDRMLDAAKTAFASLALAARLERAGESFVLILGARDRSSYKTMFSDYPEIRFYGVPLGLADGRKSHLADLAILSGGDLRFDLTISQTGTFLLVQLTHRSSPQTKQFVIRLDIKVNEKFWAERRTAFLKANLSPSDFRLFLRSILFDGVAESWPGNGKDGGKKGKRRSNSARTPTLLDEMTVEDILQACTQDRSRIDEVNRLLDIFKDTEHFDAPFREFWTNFCAAVQTIETGKNL
jgi:hypothetical protein